VLALLRVGYWGSFDLILSVTPLGRSVVFVQLAKPNGWPHTRGIFVKVT
jgi:hypothetical protein